MAVSVNVHCTRHSLWFCLFQAKCYIAGLRSFCRATQGPRTACLPRYISSQECKSSSIWGFQPQLRYARHPESQGREEQGSTVFLSKRTKGYNGCSEVWAQCPWQEHLSALGLADHISQDKVLEASVEGTQFRGLAGACSPIIPSSPQAASLPPGCWGLPPTSQHQVGTLQAVGQAGMALRSWGNWGLRYSNELLHGLPDSSHQALASNRFGNSFYPGDQWHPREIRETWPTVPK